MALTMFGIALLLAAIVGGIYAAIVNRRHYYQPSVAWRRYQTDNLSIALVIAVMLSGMGLLLWLVLTAGR